MEWKTPKSRVSVLPLPIPMKNIILQKFVFCIAVTCITTDESRAQIYSDDFTSSSIDNESNAYLGGWYGSQVSFDQLFGPGSSASITGGQLDLTSTSGVRGAFLVLPPAMFGTETIFSLTVDVDEVDIGSSGNDVLARVFTGSGYDLTLSSADGLFVNPGAGSVTAFGSSTASLAAEMSLSAGEGQVLDFTRSADDAVLVFIGSDASAGWPFPEMQVASISIAALPEPSTLGLLVLSSSLVVFHRKRKSSQFPPSI